MRRFILVFLHSMYNWPASLSNGRHGGIDSQSLSSMRLANTLHERDLSVTQAGLVGGPCHEELNGHVNMTVAGTYCGLVQLCNLSKTSIAVHKNGENGKIPRGQKIGMEEGTTLQCLVTPIGACSGYWALQNVEKKTPFIPSAENVICYPLECTVARGDGRFLLIRQDQAR